MIDTVIQKYIDIEGLISSGSKVLVTLSGGADSVALLRVLLHLGYSCEAAHCNFHLRGEESDRDEAFVRELCRETGVKLHVTHFNTVAYSLSKSLSIEMGARELRYGWFEEKRIETGAAVVAVAHHRDDSVETVLLNLIRGTGINGLKGIRSRNGFVVRPLLCVGREEIINYLSFLKQDYVTDSTNLQDQYTRNKIRLNILPAMESINPSVAASIFATALRLGEVSVIYNKVIGEGKQRVFDGKSIYIPDLKKEPSPTALLYEILYPLGFNAAQISAVFSSLDGQPGRRFYSQEWCILKDRNSLLVQPVKKESLCVDSSISLPDSGEMNYGNPPKQIKIIRVSCTSDFAVPRSKDTACLDVSKLSFPLELRIRREGDRFVPFGMKGMKSVTEYLTDRKYSLHEKEQTYVVCSGGEIVWIVGERSDNRFRLDDRTAEVLLLQCYST